MTPTRLRIIAEFDVENFGPEYSQTSRTDFNTDVAKVFAMSVIEAIPGTLVYLATEMVEGVPIDTAVTVHADELSLTAGSDREVPVMTPIIPTAEDIEQARKLIASCASNAGRALTVSECVYGLRCNTDWNTPYIRAVVRAVRS